MPSSASPLRVLFVEDAPDLRRAYERYFSDRYEVAFASTGAEAVQQSAIFHPQVVVLDMRLPDTDGVEVLRKLQQQVDQLKVVITSAYSSMEPIVDVLGLHYNRYLVKPFDLQELEAAIDGGA